MASKAGVGSTFALYVRARRCAPPEDPKPIHSYHVDMKAQSKIISPGAISRLQNGSSHPTHNQISQPVAPKHVLIVEDNIVNQKVLTKQLRSAGCTSHVANHGGEALSFLSTTKFWAGNEIAGVLLHVILMDLEMPEMDGLTCVRKIRELQADGVLTRHVPLIAVTANGRGGRLRWRAQVLLHPNLRQRCQYFQIFIGIRTWNWRSWGSRASDAVCSIFGLDSDNSWGLGYWRTCVGETAYKYRL